MKRTQQIIKILRIKNGEELTKLYLKSDLILLTCVFDKFIKVSINEFDINLLYSVSVPCYTWQCVLKYTDIDFEKFQDKDMILLLENNIKIGISSVMGDRYVKTDEKKIVYFDAKNLYRHPRSQPLPYEENKFDENVRLKDIFNTPDVKLKVILNTPDDSDIGYFVGVD